MPTYLCPPPHPTTSPHPTPVSLLMSLANVCQCPAATELKGVPNNVEFLRRLVRDPRFIAGDTTTKFLEGFSFTPRVAEVILPGE